MSAPAQPARSGRSPFVVVLTLTLAVFAAVVGFVTWQLRSGLRDQILSHEGEWLATVATMQDVGFHKNAFIRKCRFINGVNPLSDQGLRHG